MTLSVFRSRSVAGEPFQQRLHELTPAEFHIMVISSRQKKDQQGNVADGKIAIEWRAL